MTYERIYWTSIRKKVSLGEIYEKLIISDSSAWYSFQEIIIFIFHVSSMILWLFTGFVKLETESAKNNDRVRRTTKKIFKWYIPQKNSQNSRYLFHMYTRCVTKSSKTSPFTHSGGVAWSFFFSIATSTFWSRQHLISYRPYRIPTVITEIKVLAYWSFAEPRIMSCHLPTYAGNGKFHGAELVLGPAAQQFQLRRTQEQERGIECMLCFCVFLQHVRYNFCISL